MPLSSGLGEARSEDSGDEVTERIVSELGPAALRLRGSERAPLQQACCPVRGAAGLFFWVLPQDFRRVRFLYSAGGARPRFSRKLSLSPLRKIQLLISGGAAPDAASDAVEAAYAVRACFATSTDVPIRLATMTDELLAYLLDDLS